MKKTSLVSLALILMLSGCTSGKANSSAAHGSTAGEPSPGTEQVEPAEEKEVESIEVEEETEIEIEDTEETTGL